MAGQISRWVGSDNKSTRRHQELVEAINDSYGPTVEGELEAHSLPGGKSIIDTRLPITRDRRIAKIIAPENSAHTYTDARYRLEVLHIVRNDVDNTSGTDPLSNVVFDKVTDEVFPAGGGDGATSGGGANDDIGAHLTAINMLELSSLKTVEGTHTLPEDGTFFVECFCIYDREDASQPHWFFLGGLKIKYLKLTANWTSATPNLLVGNPSSDMAGTVIDTGTTKKIAWYSPPTATAVGGATSSLAIGNIIPYFPITPVAQGGNTVSGIALPTAANNIPSIGTLQYQVYQMTTNTTAGWTYPMIHP